jgi:O-acetyl-ADP-ribose deacetylase (regulator of RNase III)
VERIGLQLGDITTDDADAIVNAANRSLLGAGASTARSTARPGRACSPSAASSAAVRPATPRSPAATTWRPAT